ncbi:LytR/AlgR family response regulator transcription factor [Haloimpatiens sp. FM7315]|uniref:LytR/AlgR family response regulator transcription factor n=1 Tax=Haloimpatiens sp. FM7315 TaxID=3298609 RepID=UPI00370AFF03
MNKINIAILDDEEVQVLLLKKYVKNWAKNKDIIVNIKEFYTSESFEFKWSMDKSYDIFLLDIQMKGQNGVELAKVIRKEDENIKIIFVTAMYDYIQIGYDLDAINYLIKPIKEEKLWQCLDKSLDKIPKDEKTIIVDSEGEIFKISEKSIVYIEAFAHYVEINTCDKKYVVRKSIGSIEKELDENMFVRCHRSYLVGIKYIKRIKGSEIELDNGENIPLSRRRYKDTNKAFIRYFRGEVNE